MLLQTLDQDQSLAVFNKIAGGEDIKLRNVQIDGSNLSHIPSDLLSEVVLRLESVDLIDTDLTPAQSIAIYTLIAERKSSKLKEVFLTEALCVSADLRLKAEETGKLKYMSYMDNK